MEVFKTADGNVATISIHGMDHRTVIVMEPAQDNADANWLSPWNVTTSKEWGGITHRVRMDRFDNRSAARKEAADQLWLAL